MTTRPLGRADRGVDLSQLTGSVVGPRDALDEPMPARLGDYLLLRSLGSGGMGAVFESEHLYSKRRVAIKLVSSRIATNPASLERFHREGMLASQISHPRCVFVLAAEQDAGRPYIVMELMPGQTLRDVVNQRGPLPVLEAVHRTLELIEGLAEAHRMGVVHRDIKPSNCFVMQDGSIKVGDFGLSKSLLSNGHLTNTGAFLGTVLFAAPEQLRGERVDFTSDVYSVCATLYFLVTGQAPFDHQEPSVAMARALTESPIPPRKLRPDLPHQLERIILRGLERERSRRWQSLDDLQRQLLALVPQRMTLSGTGARILAYLIDEAILRIVLIPLLMAGWLALGNAPPVVELDGVTWSDQLLFALVALVYFTLGDGLWRGTPGKHWVALRVCRVNSTNALRLGRGLIRTLCFLTALYGTQFLALWYASIDNWQLDDNGLLWLSLLAQLSGLLLLGSPIVFGLGYRGLHDLLSGAAVVLQPWPRHGVRVSSRVSDDPLKQFDPLPTDWPQTLAAWRLLGVRRGADGRAVALAEDPVLIRRVIVWLSPDTSAPDPSVDTADPAEINRSTRLRCLGTGRVEVPGQTLRWQAYVAPEGFPLTWVSTPSQPLDWATARLILEQLSDELDAAIRDGTCPSSLSLEQVYVSSNTRVQLLEAPLDPAIWTRAETVPASLTDTSTAGHPSARRGLELLRQCAAVCLQGTAGSPGQRIAAPVPRYAAAWLARLSGLRKPFATMTQAREQLAAYSGYPPKLSTRWRLTLLLIQQILMTPATLVLLLIGLYLSVNTFVVQSRSQELAWLADAIKHDAFRQHLPTQTRTALSEPGFAEWLQREHDIAKQTLQLLRQLLLSGDRLVLDWLTYYSKQNSEFASVLQTDPASAPTETSRLLLNTYLDEYRTTHSGYGPGESQHRFNAPHFAILPGVAVLLVVLLWVWLFRGGLIYPFVGTALVQRDGRAAMRWRCMLRAAAVWAVPTILMVASVVCVEWRMPTGHAWCLAGVLGWLMLISVLSLIWPERGLQDRIAGTFIVPR